MEELKSSARFFRFWYLYFKIETEMCVKKKQMIETTNFYCHGDSMYINHQVKCDNGDHYIPNMAIIFKVV